MEKRCFIILSSLVFIYLLIRGIYAPIPYDELSTFHFYIKAFTFNPFSNALPDANNHLLNSILSGVSLKAFGFSTLSIRLPNLLSFIVYALYLYKTGLFLKTTFLRWALYLSLLTPIYFLAFFAYSRGYGMSMAFLMSTIYYLIRITKNHNLKHLVYLTLFAILALFSNLSLLVLIGLILLLSLIFSLKYNKSKQRIISLILLSIPIAISYFIALMVLLQLKELDLLYYGSCISFWQSLILPFLDLMLNSRGTLAQIGVIYIGLSILFTFAYISYKQKGIKIDRNQVIFLLLFLASISVELMAKLLHINYPADRVAIYFYPLIIVSFCFLVNACNSVNFQFLLLPLFIIPLSFISNFNFDKCSIWKNNFIVNNYNEIIGKNTVSADRYAVNLTVDTKGNFKTFVPELTEKNENLVIFPYSDFIISKKNEFISEYYTKIDSTYRAFSLFERKKKIRFTSCFETNLFPEVQFENEFEEYVNYTSEASSKNLYKVNYSFEITTKKQPVNTSLVFQLSDNKGKILSYKRRNLSWVNIKDKTISVNEVILSDFIATNDKIKVLVYIWNPDKEIITISNAKFKISNAKTNKLSVY